MCQKRLNMIANVKPTSNPKPEKVSKRMASSSTKKEKLGKLGAVGFSPRDCSMRDPLILAESGYLAMMEFAP